MFQIAQIVSEMISVPCSKLDELASFVSHYKVPARLRYSGTVASMGQNRGGIRRGAIGQPIKMFQYNMQALHGVRGDRKDMAPSGSFPCTGTSCDDDAWAVSRNSSWKQKKFCNQLRSYTVVHSTSKALRS